MKHIKHRPIRYWWEDFSEKVSNKFASFVENFDKNNAESNAFRKGEYCDERRVLLREIRLMKALLCIDLICTVIMAFIMVA